MHRVHGVCVAAVAHQAVHRHKREDAVRPAQRAVSDTEPDEAEERDRRHDHRGGHLVRVPPPHATDRHPRGHRKRHAGRHPLRPFEHVRGAGLDPTDATLQDTAVRETRDEPHHHGDPEALRQIEGRERHRIRLPVVGDLDAPHRTAVES